MFNLDLFCDLHMLMGMFCLLPLLESVNAIIKFAQRRDIFICDFVAIVKIYQTNLYKWCIQIQIIINMSISKCF
jgi:hypothetical protein